MINLFSKTSLFGFKKPNFVYLVMPKIHEHILKDIQSCATIRELEDYRNQINRTINDLELRLPYMGALGARYFDILQSEQIARHYYPQFTHN